MPDASKDSSPYEDVTRSLRCLVLAKRRRGVKWDASFRDVGVDLGVSCTVVRSLFYRLKAPSTMRHNWLALRDRIADYLEREAEELLRQADEYEMKAKMLREGSGLCENAGSASRRISVAWQPASSNTSNAG